MSNKSCEIMETVSEQNSKNYIYVFTIFKYLKRFLNISRIIFDKICFSLYLFLGSQGNLYRKLLINFSREN